MRHAAKIPNANLDPDILTPFYTNETYRRRERLAGKNARLKKR